MAQLPMVCPEAKPTRPNWNVFSHHRAAVSVFRMRAALATRLTACWRAYRLPWVAIRESLFYSPAAMIDGEAKEETQPTTFPKYAGSWKRVERGLF